MADQIRQILDIGGMPPRVLILRMRHVLVLDATGIQALRDLQKACRHQGTQLMLSGIHAQPHVALDRADFLSELGQENVAASIDLALQRANRILEPASTG